jgi:hypothetical protein
MTCWRRAAASPTVLPAPSRVCRRAGACAACVRRAGAATDASPAPRRATARSSAARPASTSAPRTPRASRAQPTARWTSPVAVTAATASNSPARTATAYSSAARPASRKVSTAARWSARPTARQPRRLYGQVRRRRPAVQRELRRERPRRRHLRVARLSRPGGAPAAVHVGVLVRPVELHLRRRPVRTEHAAVSWSIAIPPAWPCNDLPDGRFARARSSLRPRRLTSGRRDVAGIPLSAARPARRER